MKTTLARQAGAWPWQLPQWRRAAGAQAAPAGRPAVLALLMAVALLAQGIPGRAQAPAPQNAMAGLSDALGALVARVSPSVVEVSGEVYGMARGAGSGGVVDRQRSTGSGIIVDRDGFILTNHHVVAGARRVQVRLSAMRTPGVAHSIVPAVGSLLNAVVVGVDEETDLAVLKIEATDLSALPLADSDDLRPGQIVLAVGSPLGLTNSVTMGVVSAVGRQLAVDAPMVYIQSDASVNPGHSGGPLVDVQGRLVGVNTLILSQSGGSEGVSFAAPSNIVRDIYDQIRAHGRVRRGTIGAVTQTITPTLAAGLGLPRARGIVVSDLDPGGPASAAGLRIGDLISELDGKAMENARQFDVNLYRRTGAVATIDVLRGDTPLRFVVAVTERPDDPLRFLDLVSAERNLIDRLGVVGLDINREIAALVGGVRSVGGVVIAGRAGGDGQDSDLRPGDVVLAVNGTPVRDVAHLRLLVDPLPRRTPVALQIQRASRLMFLAFEIE